MVPLSLSVGHWEGPLGVRHSPQAGTRPPAEVFVHVTNMYMEGLFC